MPDLISPDFIFGVIAGIILSSVIPIKIQFGREADKPS